MKYDWSKCNKKEKDIHVVCWKLSVDNMITCTVTNIKCLAIEDEKTIF